MEGNVCNEMSWCCLLTKELVVSNLVWTIWSVVHIIVCLIITGQGCRTISANKQIIDIVPDTSHIIFHAVSNYQLLSIQWWRLTIVAPNMCILRCVGSRCFFSTHHICANPHLSHIHICAYICKRVCQRICQRICIYTYMFGHSIWSPVPAQLPAWCVNASSVSSNCSPHRYMHVWRHRYTWMACPDICWCMWWHALLLVVPIRVGWSCCWVFISLC